MKKTRVDEFGVVTNTYYNEADDKLTIETVQDAEPIIEYAQRARDAHNPGRELYFAGIYPDTIVEAFCKQRGITFEEFILDPEHGKALMRDPDLSKFRVWKGRV